MKFGGSSVADPEKISTSRAASSKRASGVRVVATVSAMGDTTDALLELARPTLQPHPRELDMLLDRRTHRVCTR